MDVKIILEIQPQQKNCMKKFCGLLRDHVMKIISFKEKKIKLLTKEQKESYKNSKTCYICRGTFENKYLII